MRRIPAIHQPRPGGWFRYNQLRVFEALSGLLLRGMQRFMRLLVGRPRVAAAPFGQLDAAQVLHVRAVVQLVGVACGRVADQESGSDRRARPPADRGRGDRRRSPGRGAVRGAPTRGNRRARRARSDSWPTAARAARSRIASRVTPSPFRVGWNRETSRTWAGSGRFARSANVSRNGRSTCPSIVKMISSLIRRSPPAR